MYEDTSDLVSVFFIDGSEGSEPIDDDILSAMRLAFDNTHIEFSTKMRLSERVRVVSETARILLEMRTPQLVLDLRKLTQPDLKDRPKLLSSWINAAHATDDEDALTEALRELRVLAVKTPNLRDFYMQMKMVYSHVSDADDYIWRWGPIPTDLLSYLKGIDPVEASGFVTQALIDKHYALRQPDGMSADDFGKRLKWGNAVAAYLNFLGRFRTGVQTKLENGGGITDDEQAICDIHTSISTIYKTPDYSPIKDILNAGQSVVLLCDHTGYSNAIFRPQNDTDIPMSHITMSKISTANDQSLKIISPAMDGMQIAFMRLIKAMRSNPRLVVIYPDGGFGQDFSEHELLGETVKLGRGATKIAYSGRAATFYLSLGWQGDQLQTTFVPGPKASPAEDPEQFETRLAEFYLKCVGDVLLGPPENLGLVRAFWPSFSK